jgi:hypothetical protein
MLLKIMFDRDMAETVEGLARESRMAEMELYVEF